MHDLPGWFYCDLYSLFIMIFVLVNVYKNSEAHDRQQSAFVGMLKTTILLLALDAVTKLGGRPAPVNYFVAAANCLSFAIGPLVMVFWMRYLGCAMFPGCEEKADKWVNAVFILSVMNAVISVLSVPFGWTFYLDEKYVYHRGPGFLIPALLVFSMIVLSEAFVFVNRSRIDRRHIFSMNFFLVPPILCGTVQTLFYGSSLVLSGLAFSELIVFVHIQNGGMNVDYLTGAYNRRRLDRQIREKIRLSTEAHTFAAILIDLDNFKSINDTMGHNVGDCALEDTVAILRESIRTNDLLARYGGDEFCIVLDTATEEELAAIIVRIEKKLASFNRDGDRPYKLSFSMGYQVYDVRSGMNAEQFQKVIDEHMYENKRQHHGAAPVCGPKLSK